MASRSRILSGGKPRISVLNAKSGTIHRGVRELAEQAMNVPGEQTCFLSREIADEPFAQDHQRPTTVETRGGDLQLADVEHVDRRDHVQRARRDIVPPSNVFEELELRRHDIA